MELIVLDLSPRNAGGIPDTDEGQKNFLQMIVTRIAEGESLASRELSDGRRLPGICGSLKIPFSVVWAWIEADQKRVNAYESALRARADSMVNDSIGIVMGAYDKDEVPVASLQAGHLLKVAKSWDRARYGDALIVKNEGRTVVKLSFGGVKPLSEPSEDVSDVSGDVPDVSEADAVDIGRDARNSGRDINDVEYDRVDE